MCCTLLTLCAAAQSCSLLCGLFATCGKQQKLMAKVRAGVVVSSHPCTLLFSHTLHCVVACPARDILARLTQFRQFYMIVVGYVYFTRIIVYLMSITLSYKLVRHNTLSCCVVSAVLTFALLCASMQTWLGPLSSELATLAFFFVTGYKFRPTSENPYLQVKTEDDEDDEDVSAARRVHLAVVR